MLDFLCISSRMPRNYQGEMILLLGEPAGRAVVKTQSSFSWKKKKSNQIDSKEEIELKS